jgi:hypothetical protein
MSLLSPVAPPALPFAPEDYLRAHQDQHDNVLRLYFNRLSGIANSLIGANGGRFVEVPYGLFFDLTDQTLTLPNTAKPITYNQTYLSNAVAIQNSSEIIVSIGGVYNFQFSAQLVSSNSSAKQVYVWIKRNNIDIGYSTHQYTISGGNVHLEINWNFNIDLQAGDFLELEWAANNVNVTLETTAATAPHPGIPSAVMTVNYISPLPEVLPTPP